MTQKNDAPSAVAKTATPEFYKKRVKPDRKRKTKPAAMDGESLGKKLAQAMQAAAPAAPEPAALTDEQSKDERRALADKLRAERLQKNGGHEAVEIYWNKGAAEYLMRHQGIFENFPKKEMKLHLLRHGFSPTGTRDGVPEIECPFIDAMNHRKVDHAGSLPGYRVGLVNIGRRRVLITEEPDPGVWAEVPRKVAPEPAFFAAAVREVLWEYDQWIHFCLWLAVALRSLRRGDFKPGQLCVLVGKADSGKSLLQLFITAILGGRSEKMNSAILEGDKFTGNLSKAEHWFSGDPVAPCDMKSRLALGGRVKDFFHEEEFSFRGMYSEGFKVSCFRRGSISINDEPEDLLVLPPMRSGLEDKINLYRCVDKGTSGGRQIPLDCVRRFVPQSPLPGFDSKDGVDRSAIRKAVFDETPAIRAWLLTRFADVPADLVNLRCGVKAWHHPQVLTELGELSPESKFLSVVDEVLFRVARGAAGRANWQDGATDADAVEATAMELSAHLGQSTFSDQIKNDLRHTGRIFARLEKSYPHRISRRVLHGVALVKVSNPFKHKQQDQE